MTTVQGTQMGTGEWSDQKAHAKTACLKEGDLFLFGEFSDKLVIDTQTLSKEKEIITSS